MQYSPSWQGTDYDTIATQNTTEFSQTQRAKPSSLAVYSPLLSAAEYDLHQPQRGVKSSSEIRHSNNPVRTNNLSVAARVVPVLGPVPTKLSAARNQLVATVLSADRWVISSI
jgi:hypothetical protein